MRTVNKKRLLSTHVMPGPIKGYERHLDISYSVAYCNKETGKWFQRPGFSHDLVPLNGLDPLPRIKLGGSKWLLDDGLFEVSFSEFIEKDEE